MLSRTSAALGLTSAPFSLGQAAVIVLVVSFGTLFAGRLARQMTPVVHP